MRKKKNLQLALIILFVAVSLLFGYLSITELIDMGKQTMEILYINGLVDEQHVHLKKMREAEKQSHLLEANYLEIQRMLPESPFQDQVIIQIQQIADSASVTFKNIEFGVREQEEQIVVMPMKLSFKGNYKSFLNLISGIMYGERLIRIDGINLENSDEGLQIEILANSFYKGIIEKNTKTKN